MKILRVKKLREFVWGLSIARIKKWKKTDPQLKKWGSVFFNFFIGALLRPQIAVWRHATILYVWKLHFWENDKILITQPILVPFLSLSIYGIQDLWLSHTLTQSFSHFHKLFTHFSHNLSYLGQSYQFWYLKASSLAGNLNVRSSE